MKKLAIFDIDGVVINGQFLLAAARRAGLRHYLWSVLLCLFYEMGLIRLRSLMERVFAGCRGLPEGVLAEIGECVGVRPGIPEAVGSLERAGYEVVLLSAGVPQPVVETLCRKLGVSHGRGIDLEVVEGTLTGRLSGETLDDDGKVRYAEGLLRAMGIGWPDVLAIGDDRGNIPLFRRAGLTVGFRTMPSLARYARFEITDRDLPGLPASLLRRRYHPVLRKLLHLSGVGVIALHVCSPRLAIGMLAGLSALYLVSELLRRANRAVPLMTTLTRLCIRRTEEDRLALAPLALASGLALCLLVFPPRIAYAAVAAACVGDVAAMAVGTFFGRTPILYSRRKSLEGSLAHFLSTVLVCCLVLGEPMWSFCLVAALLESIPLGDGENFVVPVLASGCYWLVSGG